MQLMKLFWRFMNQQHTSVYFNFWSSKSLQTPVSRLLFKHKWIISTFGNAVDEIVCRNYQAKKNLRPKCAWAHHGTQHDFTKETRNSLPLSWFYKDSDQMYKVQIGNYVSRKKSEKCRNLQLNKVGRQLRISKSAIPPAPIQGLILDLPTNHSKVLILQSVSTFSHC